MKIISLPDNFVDIIVKEKLEGKENIKSDIIIKPGGNATNFSIGLGILGVKNILICNLGKLSEYILNNFLEKNKILDKIEIYKIHEIDSITVAIEKEDRIMYTDSKGIQIKNIEKYYDIIKDSDYIFFGNWNNNVYSNDLLQYLIENFKSKIYIDTGDPSIAKDRIEDFIDIIKNNIWTLSINDYELLYFTDYLGIMGNLIEKANKFYEYLKIENLDIHSPDFVYSLPSKTLIKINKVSPKILTGAGDIWDSANFYGYINNLDNKKRLELANEFAKRYINGELIKSI